MEPRKVRVVGAVSVKGMGRQHSCAVAAWRKGSDRGQRARHTATGVTPGTWEIPPSPPKKEPVRVPADQRSRLAAGRVPAPRERNRGTHRRYEQDKGNQACPEGWWEVRELNSTEEAGEPTAGTRWREGSSVARNRMEG